MGLLGGLCLLGGLGFVIVGLIGLVIGVFDHLNLEAMSTSAIILVAGLIVGGLGTAILE